MRNTEDWTPSFTVSHEDVNIRSETSDNTHSFDQDYPAQIVGNSVAIIALTSGKKSAVEKVPKITMYLN